VAAMKMGGEQDIDPLEPSIAAGRVFDFDNVG
jgi:hypothetical protein